LREKGLPHKAAIATPAQNVPAYKYPLGLDILEFIQVTAADITPEELFPQFGDRLSFHGAIDEVHLLPHATPKQVYDETTHIIDILGANGGFIVAPSHQVQGDTPVDNVLAIFATARNYRY